MSPFFVSYIKKTCSCTACKASPREGYRCCDKHLAYAREAWRTWAVTRRAAKLCINCDRKAWDGGDRLNSLGRRIGCAKGARLLRCRRCTMRNRKKCARWTAAHPGYSRQQWERSKALIDAGVCPCAAKNRLVGGFRRCEDCRKQRRGRR